MSESGLYGALSIVHTLAETLSNTGGLWSGFLSELFLFYRSRLEVKRPGRELLQ